MIGYMYGGFLVCKSLLFFLSLGGCGEFGLYHLHSKGSGANGCSQHHVISKIPQGKVMEKSDNFVSMKLLSKPETKVSSVYTWTGDTAEGVKIFAYKK